jgi:hypothetical protein
LGSLQGTKALEDQPSDEQRKSFPAHLRAA